VCVTISIYQFICVYSTYQTRYLIVAKSVGGVVVDPAGVQTTTVTTAAKKATLALALRNIPGALFKMSSCFAFRNIDINKIESRPATLAMHLHYNSSSTDRPFTQRHWDLVFFIDYEPSADAAVNEALNRNLLEHCEWIKDLGTYRSGLHGSEAEQSTWSALVDVVAY
jgi:prephenate dehydratase